MQELFRISHGRVETDGNGMLRDYNMAISKGEILYIQGLRESGIQVLIKIFSGEIQLQKGEAYIKEELCIPLSKEKLRSSGIYTITAEADLVKSLSVAENLENIRWVPHPMRLYDRKKSEKKVSDYLKKEGINLQSDLQTDTLSSSECQILSILKAKMHGASLIVLDCTRDEYEGKKAEKLCEKIKKMSSQGIAFVILTESYQSFADIADRIQMMHRGRDLMEWFGINERLKMDLIDPGAMSDTKAVSRQVSQNILSGIYDYEWEPEKGFLLYLQNFYRENIRLWEEATGMDYAPRKYGMQRKMVIMGRENMDMCFDSMSIKDNITMTIPQRVGHGRYGMINKKFRNIICEKFYTLADVPKSCEHMGKLNRVQRRILSLYRWEVARPKVMILDNPYIGLSQEEAAVIREYLEHLDAGGIRVIYFLQSLEELKQDCKVIFRSHGGNGFSRMD